jgi:CheY-like chemotaxis protein
MRLLFLDDDLKRHHKFKAMTSEHKVDFCLTADEAIDLLRQNKYDAVFLDHDLQGTYQPSTDHNTGYTVVKYIVENNDIRIPLIVIHSWNGSGAANMLSAVIPGKVVASPFGNWKIQTRNGVVTLVVEA